MNGPTTDEDRICPSPSKTSLEEEFNFTATHDVMMDKGNENGENENENNGGVSGQTGTVDKATDLEMGDIGTTGDENNAKEKAQEILNKLRGDLTYTIDDVPRWYNCILFGFQHYLTMFGGTLSVPLLLAEALCIKENLVAQGELIGTIFFVSGLITLLQSSIGIRLPLVQGGSAAFLLPALTILAQAGPCPSSQPTYSNESTNAPTDEPGNYTTTEPFDDTEIWHMRMRTIQGSIIVASLVEVFVGFTGIIGIMLRYIGPLTIAPTITLIGLPLFTAATSFSSGHWGIAFLTIALMAIFSQYMARFGIPFLACSKEEGCHRISYPVFKFFPVVLSILIAWALCVILTVCDVFPSDPEVYGYQARTDIRLKVLEDTPWIRIPYPCQWGVPNITVAGVFGMIAGVLASIFESVGDYYACARLAGAPPPPIHAINRGIGIEGLGCILAGIFGTGNGTTTYSENIGALGITKVGCRRAIQYSAAFMLLLGMFAKFGALFVTIPNPIIGGMFAIMFGMVAAIGISNLQFVNLNSSRNLFVIGFSLIMGFIIPSWVSANEDFINTGVSELDQIFIVLLETNMFVGGIIGFFLDNTMPGSDEDRGIAQWRTRSSDNKDSAVTKELMRCYDFPIGMNWIRRVKFFRYLPMCPTFQGFNCGSCSRCCRRRGSNNSESEETHF